MLYHEVRQPRTVDKDHTLSEMFDIFNSLGAETERCDKDTLRCAKPEQTAYEPLNFRSTNTDMRRVAFCLDIDTIKPQSVFINHAIDPTITSFAQLQRSLLVCTPI